MSSSAVVAPSPSMAGRDRKRSIAVTTDVIIDSAARKFAEFGIDRVSLDEIAHAAHVHRSTLHRHFPEGRDAADALSAELTELVMLSRGNQTVRLLLAQDAGKQALLSSATTRFGALAGEHWRQIAQRDRIEGFHVTAGPADAVVAHLLRTGLSLVTDPGELSTPDAVRDTSRSSSPRPSIGTTPQAEPKSRSAG